LFSFLPLATLLTRFLEIGPISSLRIPLGDILAKA
jgi:hypothetical protein